MIPFLVAILLALIIGGTLVVIWRERRELFRTALAISLALLVLAMGYVWWVSYGYTLTGDARTVSLSELTLEPVAGSYRLRGLVNNLSPELAVSVVPITLQVADCADATKPTSCHTLFNITRTLSVSVPPGTSRAFVLVFSPPAMAVRGSLQWHAKAGTPRTHRPVAR